MVAQPWHEGSIGPLLDAAAAGDGAAWDSLVERFTGLLWSTARAHRLSPADSADVVQTTWLRLVENLGRIQDPERLGGWLATTARRECLVVLRRSRREPPVGDERLLDTVPAQRSPLDASLLADERDAALWRVFDELPDRCRRLLRVLLADPAPSYAEVSESLGIPVGSIGPTRQRCLSSLRQLAVESGALDPGDLDLTDRTVSLGGES